jgi:osmotically-inducible protein OsmY
MRRVTISVRDGHVTLRGTVRSDLDERVIMDNLRELPGVGHIKNELRVNPNWD